jgi:hypothetical protein
LVGISKDRTAQRLAHPAWGVLDEGTDARSVGLRRKLDACRENHPRHTTVLLALIRQLYDLEDRAKLWTPPQRLELRQRESVRVPNQIRVYLDGPELERLLPKSDLAEAVGYLKNNWDALLLYTTDGRFPIDNNETEHLMKQVRAPTRSGWSGPQELAAHRQLGGGRSGGELDDDHQHGGPQRPGRWELSQRRVGPNAGRLHGLGIVASRSLERTASRGGAELSGRRTSRCRRPPPRPTRPPRSPPPADKQEGVAGWGVKHPRAETPRATHRSFQEPSALRYLHVAALSTRHSVARASAIPSIAKRTSNRV